MATYQRGRGGPLARSFRSTYHSKTSIPTSQKSRVVGQTHVKSLKQEDTKPLTSYSDAKAKGAFGGIARYAKANNITFYQAKKLLQNQPAYTLHKPLQQKFSTLPTLVHVRDEQWQADLVEMQKWAWYNSRVRYLLTVIDILSKYVWVEPLKDKTGASVKAAFERIFAKGRRPQLLQTDHGTEFFNKTMKAFFQKEHIGHFSTEGDVKGAVIERFNRTLKDRLYRYMTARHTKKYLDVLPDLVATYNEDDVHRSIGMTPQEVNDDASELEAWMNLYHRKKRKGNKARPQLKVGDYVRLSERARAFKKGFDVRWTPEVFQVSEVIRSQPIVYKVKEWDGTPLKGSFYEADLQKVPRQAAFEARIDKIEERRGKNAVLVKWVGWPAKYNSWMTKGEYKKRKAAEKK